MRVRITILFVFIAMFLSVLALIPESPGMKPSRLARKLPDRFGIWVGKPGEPSLEEKQKLAADTDFERMSYFDPAGIQPPVETSIVFSGKNLSQSIHRPEVCYRAQGWQFVSENYLTFEGVLPDGEDLPVKEIICKQVWMVKGEDGKPKPRKLENGEDAVIWRAFYYTFFGYEQIVPGHYQRTIIDIQDRLLKGHDQRWAYATFSSYITKKHADQGFRIYRSSIRVLDEEGAKEHIKNFLQELLPLVVSPPAQGNDESLEAGKTPGS